MEVCIVINPEGQVVTRIRPSFNLNDLYESAAEYACGQHIPTAYAQQGVMEKLYKEGYSVKWAEC